MKLENNVSFTCFALVHRRIIDVSVLYSARTRRNDSITHDNAVFCKDRIKTENIEERDCATQRHKSKRPEDHLKKELIEFRHKERIAEEDDSANDQEYSRHEKEFACKILFIHNHTQVNFFKVIEKSINLQEISYL
jgi:hypothetical protein